MQCDAFTVRQKQDAWGSVFQPPKMKFSTSRLIHPGYTHINPNQRNKQLLYKNRNSFTLNKCFTEYTCACNHMVLAEWLLRHHLWLWKRSLGGLLTERHWLMKPIICRSSAAIALAFRRRETLPNRQLRMLLMYAVELHSWWQRQKYTQTHSLHAHVEGTSSSSSSLWLLINLRLFQIQTLICAICMLLLL